MAPATRLILLRHGHTAANGGGDGAPMSGGRTDTALSPLGEEQAALLAARLGPQFARVPVYSSPLSRATRTARPLAAAAGSPVRVQSGLREIDCGELEGVPIAEVKRRHRAAWEENLRQADPEFRWPGGESYREFRRRCLAELAGLAAAHPGGRVLVVTHAGVVSQAVGAAAGVSPACWALFRPGNASITELLWGPAGGTLVRFDDRTHLAAAAHDPAPPTGADRAGEPVTAFSTTRPPGG